MSDDKALDHTDDPTWIFHVPDDDHIAPAPSTCHIGQLNSDDRQWIENLLPTHTADFGPDLEFFGPGCSALGGSAMIAAEMEEVVDLVVGGEEPLRLAGRFELLHLPLSSARRLMRVFRSVVQPPVLAMLDAGHDLSFGRAVAGQLVGNHDAWRSHLLLQEFA
jgi:hypothetical protein